MHPDHRAVGADVAVPAQGGCFLHCHPGPNLRREHRISVVDGLAVEQLPARHADDPDRCSFGSELVVGGDGQLHLAACAR